MTVLALLAAHGILPSMSRIGSPYDNAKAESFTKTLTQEEVDWRAYRDADEARLASRGREPGKQSPLDHRIPILEFCGHEARILEMRIDGMKRLTPHSTWWHRLPHRDHALTGARRRGPAMDHIGIDVHKKESQICILAEGERMSLCP